MKMKLKPDEKEQGRFIGMKLTYFMYIFVLVAAVMVAYFVVLQYMKYQTIFTSDDIIEIVVQENTVDTVKDEMQPYLLTVVESTKKVSITLKISASGYEVSYSSKDAVKSFSKGMILPRELFGKEVLLSATAEDRNGFILNAQRSVMLETEPEVLFQIG